MIGSLDYWSSLPYGWIINHWLYTTLYSMVMRVNENPNLMIFRLQNLMTGFILLWISYKTAMRLVGKKIAITSVILLSLSLPFFYSAHVVRYEICEALLGYSALYLVIIRNEKRIWGMLLAGFLLIINLDVHLNAIIYPVTIAGLILFQDRFNFWRKNTFWALVIGSTLGAVVFSALHFVPDLQTYIDINNLVYGGSHQPVIMSGYVWQEIKDMFLFFLNNWNVLFVLIPIAFVAMMAQKNDTSKTMTVIIGLLFFGVFFFWPNKSKVYAILIGPPIAWLLAYRLVYMPHQLWRKALIMAIVIGAILQNLITALPYDFGKEYRQNVEQIAQLVADGDVIMGNQVYWLGLREHLYYSWEVLFFEPRVNPQMNFQDILDLYQPDILIIDGSVWSHLMQEDQKVNPRLQTERVVEKMWTVISQGELIGEFDSASHGKISLYRFYWDD